MERELYGNYEGGFQPSYDDMIRQRQRQRRRARERKRRRRKLIMQRRLIIGGGIILLLIVIKIISSLISRGGGGRYNQTDADEAGNIQTVVMPASSKDGADAEFEGGGGTRSCKYSSESGTSHGM